MKFKSLYKNWSVHNIVAHPLSEIAYLLTRSSRLSAMIHDMTLPEQHYKAALGVVIKR